MTIKMTEADFHIANNEMVGICLGCGEWRDMCEPDARNYLCKDGCGENKVYGVEELMMMGEIEFAGV